jgi:hypothetical protein
MILDVCIFDYVDGMADTYVTGRVYRGQSGGGISYRSFM